MEKEVTLIGGSDVEEEYGWVEWWREVLRRGRSHQEKEVERNKKRNEMEEGSNFGKREEYEGGILKRVGWRSGAGE